MTNSIIINNGHLSESVHIKHGVRQGCPLSSLSFLISIEPLSNYIEKDGSKQYFEHLVNDLNNVGNISGLKLNQIKIAG